MNKNVATINNSFENLGAFMQRVDAHLGTTFSVNPVSANAITLTTNPIAAAPTTNTHQQKIYPTTITTLHLDSHQLPVTTLLQYLPIYTTNPAPRNPWIDFLTDYGPCPLS